MLNKEKNNFAYHLNLPTWLRFFIVTSLVLGIFFRFTNLDRKVYWYDEAYTSLRVSGYTEAEAAQFFSHAGVISSETLQKYQHLNPERNVVDVIKSFAVEDAQHPPLYYLMARLWMKWFGSFPEVIRSLSALLSLLIFPCIYWLCLELFKSPLSAWVGVAFVAVSPIQVLYAQEAREYSLWSATILLSSAALLRAIRLKTKASWAIYVLAAVISLYTFLLSGLVLIGQCIYVIVLEGFRLSKTVIAYLLAALLATLLFLPWLITVVISWSRIRMTIGWTNNRLSLSSYIREWLINFNRIFIDWNYPFTDQFISKLCFYVSIFILLVLVGYSVYCLCIQTPQRVRLFVLTLIGCTGLALMGSDLTLGAMRSTIARYLFPCYLGIQLPVIYLFTTKLTGRLINNWQQQLWRLGMIAIISAGVISCAISSQSEIWWNKYRSNIVPLVASIVNHDKHPLLISDAQTVDLIALSYRLNPKVQLLLEPLCTNCGLTLDTRVEPNIPKIQKNYSDVLFFNPESYQKWLSRLAKEYNYKVELVSKNLKDQFWKLESNSIHSGVTHLSPKSSRIGKL